MTISGARACLLAAAVAAGIGGCRLARYELTEPIDGRAIQVKSGDRISIVLEENSTAGYVWMPECDDRDISFARETIEPDGEELLKGETSKVRIIVRVHRGFDGPSTVRLIYRRPWVESEKVRQIDLLLYHKAEDTAPWKS